MRAAAFENFDSVDSIMIREFEEPAPGPGEALVRVEAAALNHRDLWKVKDDDAALGVDFPFVPGGDLAGTVERTGDEVSNVQVGDRAVLCPLEACGMCRFCRDGPENVCEDYDSYDGAFAELALVPADRLVVLPDSVEMVDAATLPIAYTTAYRMLKLGGVTTNNLVFVPGATGGIGVASVQLADVLGAETIGSSTSGRKLSRVERLGLDHGIESGDPDELIDAVGEIGEVDVTIDHLGGPYTRVCVDVLRRNGTVIVCGRTADRYPEIDARDLYANHKRILGSSLGTQPDLEQVVSFLADDLFESVIADQYPLVDTQRAFRDLRSRNVVGKLVIRPQE